MLRIGLGAVGGGGGGVVVEDIVRVADNDRAPVAVPASLDHSLVLQL